MKRFILGIIMALITSVCAFAHTGNDCDITSTYTDYDNLAYSDNTSATMLQASAFAPVKPFDYKQTAEWGKYKALRAVGWSTFGVGLGLTSAGLASGVIALCGGYNMSAPLFAILCTGGALTVSSIPILITAYHYRNKAKKMSLSVGATSIPTPTQTYRANFSPALSFALNF